MFRFSFVFLKFSFSGGCISLFVSVGKETEKVCNGSLFQRKV